MAHLSIPFTIKRHNKYYFNARLRDSTIRVSLFTQEFNVALKIVTSVIERIGDAKKIKTMKKEKIVNLIEQTRLGIVVNANAIINPHGEESAEALSRYMHYYLNKMHIEVSSQSIPAEFESKLDLSPKKTFLEFKLDTLFDEQKEIKEQLSTLLKRLVVFDEFNNHDIDQTLSTEFVKAEEALEILLRSAKYIKESLQAGDKESAISVLNEQLSSSVKRNQYLELKQSFIEAGKAGRLSDIRKGKRPPWRAKVTNDHLRNFAVFDTQWADKTIEQITPIEVDRVFREIISNLPKSNKAPFSNMSWAERVEEAINGNVRNDDTVDDTISGKMIKGYHKTLQSFYAYLYDRHIIEQSPLTKMRFKFLNTHNRRGIFTNLQVNSIVEYCLTLDDFKKWPIIIMAFTGMRNSEVMKLTKNDVRNHTEGFSYIDINETHGKVKTEAGVRKIPIHEQLINYGFLDYLDSQNEGFLFQNDSKFLTRLYTNEIKPSCQIPDQDNEGNSLSLYSLRHRFATSLTEEGVQHEIIQALLGHEIKLDVTGKYYTHKLNVKSFVKPLNKLNFQ